MAQPAPLAQKAAPQDLSMVSSFRASDLSLGVTHLEKHSLAGLHPFFSIHQPNYSLQGCITTHLLTCYLPSAPEVSTLSAGTCTCSTWRNAWHTVHPKKNECMTTERSVCTLGRLRILSPEVARRRAGEGMRAEPPGQTAGGAAWSSRSAGTGLAKAMPLGRSRHGEWDLASGNAHRFHSSGNRS